MDTHHPKRVKPIQHAKNRKNHNHNPTPPRLQPLTIIRQFPQPNSLRLTRLPKSQMNNPTSHPTDKTRRIRQIHKPIKHHCGIIPHIQIRQCAEYRTRSDGSIRDAVVTADAEPGWGVAGHGEGVEGSAGEEHEGVSGRPGREDDSGVDDGVQVGN